MNFSNKKMPMEAHPYGKRGFVECGFLAAPYGCAGTDTMYGVPTDGGNGWGRTPCMVSLLF